MEKQEQTQAGGVPQKSAEKVAVRTHAHRGPLPGQTDKQTKEQCLKQDDFQGSSFSKGVGPAARPLRTQRGGVALRGTQLVQGAWEQVSDSEERGEGGLGAHACLFPSQKTGGQWVSEEGGGDMKAWLRTQSLKMWAWEGAMLLPVWPGTPRLLQLSDCWRPKGSHQPHRQPDQSPWP